MEAFIIDMRLAGYSEATIKSRMEVIDRLVRRLERPALTATGEELRAFQSEFVHLSPATRDIYTRHLKALFCWAEKRGLITKNPAEELVTTRVPKGRPHPTRVDDLRTIFACTTGDLRMAYMLATFAGLRRGEICRMQRGDLDLDGTLATALIHGKGGRERVVPLLRPVVDELHNYGMPRQGYVVRRDGKPYRPELLSVDSHYHLLGLGLHTTLHSMRHSFATNAVQATRDPLFVRDLLGHSSVATTEIYMDSSMRDGHLRLAGVTALAEDIAPPRRVAPLRQVLSG